MKHVFSFEWLHIKKSGLFWITAAILPLLIGFSLYLGNERVGQQLETIADLRKAESAFYAEKRLELEAIERGEAEVEMWWQNPANPLVLAQFGGGGKHVILEPRPLAALAGGQLDILPYYGRVTMTRTEPLRDNALENPFMQVVGTFDFAFVLIWLVPLFIIVMGYNVLSSERELGTWALLRSQPVPINRILFYKLLFRFLLMLAIILISLLVWAFIFGIDMFNRDGYSLFGMIVLYTAFWFALCAILSMFKTSSAVNAVSLAGLWVLFLLLIPSLISMIASAVHPIPSRALWITEQRAIEQAVQAESEALFDTWRADHPEEIVDGETPFFYEIWLQRFVINQEIKQRKQEAEARFISPKEQQAALVARVRLLSPPMWLQSWLERLAGTDAKRLHALSDELNAFQNEWNSFFLPRFQRLDFFTSEDLIEIPSPDL